MLQSILTSIQFQMQTSLSFLWLYFYFYLSLYLSLLFLPVSLFWYIWLVFKIFLLRLAFNVFRLLVFFVSIKVFGIFDSCCFCQSMFWSSRKMKSLTLLHFKFKNHFQSLVTFFKEEQKIINKRVFRSQDEYSLFSSGVLQINSFFPFQDLIDACLPCSIRLVLNWHNQLR